MPIYHIWVQNMGKKIGDRKGPKTSGSIHVPKYHPILLCFKWKTYPVDMNHTNGKPNRQTITLDCKYKTNWTLKREWTNLSKSNFKDEIKAKAL